MRVWLQFCEGWRFPAALHVSAVSAAGTGRVSMEMFTEDQRMKEIVFEVMQEGDGGYTAEALGESIFTQADTWEELRANVREAVQAFYFDCTPPASIRLRMVRDEVLALA